MTSKSVWQKADDNFREQLDLLKVKSRVSNFHQLSLEAGMPAQRINRLREQPRLMRKFEERQLMILFKKYGLEYDVTLGMGGVLNAAGY